jgi:hypothetical protein
MSLKRLQLLGQLRITDFAVVNIRNADGHAMFHFAGTQIMQAWPPLLVFFEVFGDVFREKNVPSIPTVHHSPGGVDTSPGHIHLLGQIGHFFDGAAVNPHTDSKFRVIFYRFTDFQSTQNGCFLSITKNERTSIARRQTQQLAFCFR